MHTFLLLNTSLKSTHTNTDRYTQAQTKTQRRVHQNLIGMCHTGDRIIIISSNIIVFLSLFSFTCFIFFFFFSNYQTHTVSLLYFLSYSFFFSLSIVCWSQIVVVVGDLFGCVCVRSDMPTCSRLLVVFTRFWYKNRQYRHLTTHSIGISINTNSTGAAALELVCLVILVLLFGLRKLTSIIVLIAVVTIITPLSNSIFFLCPFVWRFHWVCVFITIKSFYFFLIGFYCHFHFFLSISLFFFLAYLLHFFRFYSHN